MPSRRIRHLDRAANDVNPAKYGMLFLDDIAVSKGLRVGRYLVV